MALDYQIRTLFTWDLFRQIANNESLTLFQFNALTGLLVENGVSFDVSYVSGSRKTAAALQLTIHVNPTFTMVFVVQLEPGASAFTPSP